MNFGDMIEIKDISGKTRFSTPINKGAKGKFTLMKEDYIILPFSVSEPIPFKLGDYVDLSGVMDESLGGKLAKIYEIVDLQKPIYNNSTGGYDYQLRLDAYYWKWKNKIFKYTPESAGSEASWSLTAALDVHLGIVLRNLKALGYTYRGTEFTFSIDGTVENKAVAITYDNINILDALFTLASKDYYNCDCWITDNVIHFGRNEFGDAVKFERDVEAASVTRSESQGTYATRIFAFGSTKNIPTNYRPTDEQPVINGVVQKRLMLPVDTPFIDAYPDMYTEEAIEDVIVFDDIYPHRIGTMSDVNTVDRNIMEGQEVVGTFKAYQYKDLDLEFKEEYLIDTQELKIKFESGKLNGMEFSVQFNPNKAEPAEQLWEIVRNENYGRPLPDDTLRPEDGDKYVLSGFNIQLVSDLYIPEAEQELKERALKYVEITKKDDGIYPVTLFSDFVFADQIKHNYEFGQRVNLIDKTYFENGRESRIIGWEVKLDIPWDSPVYTVGESMPYSRFGELEDKIDALTYKGQTYTGGGSGVYIIRKNDSTAPSDSNVFSALRSLSMFLRKDQPDSTNYLLKLLGGIITDNIESQDFAAGPFGTGFLIKRDPKTGKSYIEADEIYIRLKAYFDSLEIKHLAHVGGRIVLSPASMKCIKVEKISGETDPLYDVNGERLYDSLNSELFAEIEGEANVYRCYFKTTDGEKTIYNEFDIDDFAQCREFNVKTNVSQHVSNQYYWRRVVGLGEDYIDLSIADCDTGSMEPKAGDEIVTIGNKTKPNRQHVIFLSSYDDDAPCFKLYSGINSYSMLNKEITVISPNADKNVFTGKVVIKPGSTGFSNFEDGIDVEEVNKALSDAVKAAQDAQQSANNAEGAVKDLNDYVDGAFADGIIEQSEAQAIEKYINQVNATKDEVTATYEALYVNQFLTGTAKSNLLNAKVTFMGAIDNLIAAINSAILDGKTTQTEKENVDTKYSEFISAYSDMSRAIELANQAIQEKIKEVAAEEAVTKVESQIQAVSDEAKDDLAKQMGYINGYADMVKASEMGDSLIAGGRINTKLVEAEAIVTTALIASAIMTKTLNVNNNFVVDTQGNVTLEGNAVIGGNGVFRGAIETTFVRLENSDATYSNGRYILNKKLNVMDDSYATIELPIDMSYSSKRVTIVNDVTVYSRTDQSTHIKAASSMGLYGLPIADSNRDGEAYVSELLLLTGIVELVAIPVSGKSYVRWFVTNISAAYYSVVLNTGASPEPTEYTVTTLSNPDGAGTIIGGGTQVKGYVGQLTAIPNTGYVFRNWSTGATENPLTVTWDKSKIITANFEEGITNEVQLVLSASPSNAGSVTGGGTYEKGYTALFSAKPYNGWAFSRWSDGDINIDRSVVMDGNKSFTAYFTEHESTDDNLIDIYSTTEVLQGNITFNPIGTALWASVAGGGEEYTSSDGLVMINRGLLAGKIKAGVTYQLSFKAYFIKEQSETTNVAMTFFGRIRDWEGNSIDAMVMQDLIFNVSTDNTKGITLTFTAPRNSTSEDGVCITFLNVQLYNPVFINNLELKEI